MKQEVGLWIDHRQAVIVTLQDGTESIEHVEAAFEKRGNYTSDMQPDSTGAERVDMAEDRHERHTQEMVSRYFDAVAEHLKPASTLLIMGPGPAKVEFQKHLEHRKFNGEILGVESADKLSDARIVAKVRQELGQRVQ